MKKHIFLVIILVVIEVLLFLSGYAHTLDEPMRIIALVVTGVVGLKLCVETYEFEVPSYGIPVWIFSCMVMLLLSIIAYRLGGISIKDEAIVKCFNTSIILAACPVVGIFAGAVGRILFRR